jgi:hypothetical protein
VHLAETLRDFSSQVSSAQASYSFADNRVRLIGLFGTVENLTHLTECLIKSFPPTLLIVGLSDLWQR